MKLLTGIMALAVMLSVSSCSVGTNGIHMLDVRDDSTWTDGWNAAWTNPLDIDYSAARYVKCGDGAEFNLAPHLNVGIFSKAHRPELTCKQHGGRYQHSSTPMVRTMGVEPKSK